MDQQLSGEAGRAGRYTVIRIVSRTADVSIFTFLLWWWGLEWYAAAYLISASTNWCIDFWGQKLWTFRSSPGERLAMLREFGLYTLLRLLNAVAALSCWWALYTYVGLRWWVALLITMPIFWATWFTLSRWLFYGSVRDLPALLRRAAKRIVKRRPPQ